MYNYLVYKIEPLRAFDEERVGVLKQESKEQAREIDPFSHNVKEWTNVLNKILDGSNFSTHLYFYSTTLQLKALSKLFNK